MNRSIRKNKQRSRRSKAQPKKVNKIVKKIENKVASKMYKNVNFSKQISFPTFSIATKIFLEAVGNPCHYFGQPPRVTDLSRDVSLPLFDTTVFTGGIAFEQPCDEASQATGLFIYSTYGPTSIIGGGGSENGWTTYYVPVLASGRPVVNTTNGIPHVIKTDNYDAIWILANSIRMVAYALRVTPFIEMTTDTSTQHVNNYFPCQMRYSDFTKWYNPDSATNIGSVIQNSQGFWGKYENKDGASSRYDPFQDPYLQLKYYDQEFLQAAGNSEDFGMEHLRFPGIYIVFTQAIEPVEVVEDMSKNDVFGLTIVDGQYKLQPNATIPLPKPKRHIHDIDEKKNVDANVGANIQGLWSFPIRLELRIFLEATIQCPTPLNPTPSPIDINWNAVHPYITKHQPPLWSDGHSFKSSWKWLNREVFRHVTPKNVRKAGKYGANMIRAGKQMYGDLSGAYYG